MPQTEFEFFTARESANVLGVSLRALANLRDAAMLPPPTEVGRQTLYLKNRVLELASRLVLEPPYRPAYVIRVSPKRRVNESDREWMGFSTKRYSNDDSEDTDSVTKKALAGWWPVRDPDRYIGYPLIATLTSFVVWTAEIIPDGEHRAGRFKFNTAPLNPDQAAHYAHRRLRLEKGAISLAIGFD